MSHKFCSGALILLASASLAAQSAPAPTTAATAATRDTSYIDAQGTAYVTRVVPVPPDLSPEAAKSLIRTTPDQAPPETLEHRRAQMELSTARARAAWSALCPNTIVESTIAGVPVRIVTPANFSQANRNKILINLHGGSFNADSGSYSETIPIAGYTGIKVIAVLYRLAPEHPFPAGVDDAVAVYRELLKTYPPSHMVIYGTSAGAALTAEVAVKLKQLGLPMPAALGIFSTLDRFDAEDDSQAIYSLQGFAGHLDPPDGGVHDPYYVGTTAPKDPVLSPIYADLRGLPPTLFITSGRDALLSGTANLHRAYLRAGVDARLVLFDALPHAFWYNAALPESVEANHIMANFMLRELGK
ncbi:MAG: alpha/beta hydrolase fold domain-containing protein [Acidobacteriaceae bacterium]